MNTAKLLAMTAISVFVAACGGGGGCDSLLGGAASCSSSGGGQVINLAPVANAGVMQDVVVGKDVILSGLNSRDPEGNPMTFSWKFKLVPANSKATLTNPTTPSPSFKPDTAGTYVIELTVDDGLHASPESSQVAQVVVNASVSNVAPVAVLSANPGALTGATVLLDGSGSRDANGDVLTYTWQIKSQPVGSAATLLSTAGAKSSFVPDKSGSYVIGLVVNDGLLDSDLAVVTVTATDSNVAPVANAGKDLTGAVGASVVLDGTGSTDANNADPYALIYTWTLVYRPSGSTTALLSSTSPKPAFVPDLVGLYVISLKVKDAGGLSSEESFVSVTVK